LQILQSGRRAPRRCYRVAVDPLVTTALLLAGGGAVIWSLRGRRSSERLRDLHAALDATVHATQDACGALDDAGRWIAANAGLADCIGTSARELTGAALRDALASTDRAVFDAHLRELLAGERPDAVTFDVTVAPAAGEPFVAELVLARLRAPSRAAPPIVLATLRDTTERQRRLDHQRLTERALHAATDGIVICDALADDLPIVYVNAAFERLTGYAATEVLGHNCRVLNRPENEQPALDELRAAIRERRETTVVLRNYRKDGSTFWNELTISPVADQTERVTHFLGILDDISERVELGAEHERLLAASMADKETAARAARARETLLKVVSHELRSPLNAIRLWTSLLQTSERVDDDLLRRATEQIENGVATQSRIIEDLLDVSRFESGQLELERRAVDLVALVDEVVTRNAPLADERGLRLVHERGCEQAFVLADRGRIQQVVQNLLDNACKFTPRGGEVRVATALVEQRCRVSVRDDGQGIAPDALADVFVQFWQAEDRDTRRHGGLGLGLNLVKQIVERHDGQVEAHSDGVSKGTTIVFELPLHADATSSPHRRAAPAANAPMLEGDLLVVDDDPTTVEALAIGLRLRGYEARVAMDAEQALAAIAERRPRALISDLMMRGCSGFELVERLRADEHERGLDRLPTIAITGRGTPTDRREVRAAGFDRYLQKPVRMDTLHATLDELLAQPRKAAGLNVLIACADREHGGELRAALTRQGHEVLVAHSAAEALALVHSNVPDALVAARELNDADGAVLLDNISAENGETMTVLLAPTADGERGERHLHVAPHDTAGLTRLLARWATH